MPDKSGAGGWRKRSKSKSGGYHVDTDTDPNLVHARPSGRKSKAEHRVLAEEDAQSLLSLSERTSWSGSYHSLPGTPSRTPTPTLLQQDVDNLGHEINMDKYSPRKPPKPKLAKYISGYRTVKEASKEYDFAAPWGETPPLHENIVDPLVILQSVFAHMNIVPARPIPINYNSGIFRIFADYRVVREEKVRLTELCNETFTAYRDLETYHENEKVKYDEEIRRLELLIAHGTSGMVGLIEARQNTVVKRGRTHRGKTSKHDTLMPLNNIPADQLDEQIRLRSQQVLLRKSVSPSGRMAILSRQLESMQVPSNFTVGTPPSRDHNYTLSHKMQNELNLGRFESIGGDNSFPRSVETNESGFSGKGDPLPDEEGPRPTIGSAVDLESFMALQELGTLVARKKGLDPKRFLAGLMQLFSMPINEPHCEPDHKCSTEGSYASCSDHTTDNVETQSVPEHTGWEAHPPPQLGSVRKRQRHFSFEPGDDQIAAIEEQLKAHETDDSSSSDERQETVSPRLTPTLTKDLQRRPSKIPSPAQRPPLSTKVRRESSASSTRVASRKFHGDNRRDSSSSVMTAIRHASSSGSSRPTFQKRSNSGSTLRRNGSNDTESVGKRHDMAAIAAAKAVDQADSSATKNSIGRSSLARSNVKSHARTNHLSEDAHAENALPRRRL